LRDGRATMEGERERELGLSVCEMCRLRKQITILEQTWRYKYLLGPNSQ